MMTRFVSSRWLGKRGERLSCFPSWGIFGLVFVYILACACHLSCLLLNLVSVLLCLLSCHRSLWYGAASGCDDTDFLTLTLVGCAGRCVWYPYSAVMSLGLGVPVVGCRQVLLFNFWEVSSMSMGFYWFDL